MLGQPVTGAVCDEGGPGNDGDGVGDGGAATRRCHHHPRCRLAARQVGKGGIEPSTSLKRTVCKVRKRQSIWNEFGIWGQWYLKIRTNLNEAFFYISYHLSRI